MYIENKLCLNEEKKTLESDATNHSNKFCHPAHDDEQQQLHQQQKINTLQRSSSRSTWQVYTNTYSYVVQQRTNSTKYNDNLSGQSTRCETVHGVYVTKKETATAITSQSSSSGSSTMCTYRTDFSTDCSDDTPINVHNLILEQNKNGTATKEKHHPGIEPRMDFYFIYFVIYLFSGGWVKIKLKLPHFHLSDTCCVSIKPTLPLQQELALHHARTTTPERLQHTRSPTQVLA